MQTTATDGTAPAMTAESLKRVCDLLKEEMAVPLFNRIEVDVLPNSKLEADGLVSIPSSTAPKTKRFMCNQRTAIRTKFALARLPTPEPKGALAVGMMGVYGGMPIIFREMQRCQ